MSSHDNDLWLRLALLDNCCDVRLESYCTSNDPTTARHWRVSVQRRNSQGGELVVEATSAAAALSEALDLAEHWSWHLDLPAEPRAPTSGEGEVNPR